MTFNISRRNFIRIISFLVAFSLVAFGYIFSYSRQASSTRRLLEYQYVKSITELGDHLQNIDSDLNKLLLTGTPAMLSNISSKLWRESGLAKEAISGLPVEYLSLQNTNKFLSQVGDYCVSIARESARGNEITREQKENIKALQGYSKNMLSDVLAVTDSALTGSLCLIDAQNNIDHSFDKNMSPANVTEGFTEFEEGFTAYPTLIYDGPFSDHIMEKEPQRLKGEPNVSRATAKERIAKLFNLPTSDFTDSNDEDGKMPSYGFTIGETDISVTKKGGFLSYFLRPRDVNEEGVEFAEAEKKATAFMDMLDIAECKKTYYEVSNNILTMNFAAVQDDVLIYTDLIKVGVALDNGEIVSFDARGFLVNNHKRERDFLSPTINRNEAVKSISSELSIQKVSLCVIPSGGLNEILCYEFKCKTSDGKDVLSYVNAKTGEEEQILMLIISENGQLTI